MTVSDPSTAPVQRGSSMSASMDTEMPFGPTSFPQKGRRRGARGVVVAVRGHPGILANFFCHQVPPLGGRRVLPSMETRTNATTASLPRLSGPLGFGSVRRGVPVLKEGSV